MTQILLPRIAGLKSTPTEELKTPWRGVFGTGPPAAQDFVRNSAHVVISARRFASRSLR
jgi:hypothetical protein